MKSGYALVKFPLWAWGFRPVAPIALTLKTIWLARKLLLLLRVFSKIFLALHIFKRSDWTILVICYLLSLNYCHGALLAEGDLQSWASKSLAGRILSDTRSAFRWCGVATKLPFQTFVFNRQKKIRVCWRLIRRCCVDDAVVRLLLPTLPLNRTRVETAIDVDLTFFVTCKSYSKCKHSLKLPLSLALVFLLRTN